MRILLVNDDGIHAKGIQILAKALVPKHEIIIVAPANEQSGMSQALTMGVPLQVKAENLNLTQEYNIGAYSVKGTPADCTKLALEILLNKQPDLVISGINNGANLGTDVLYSGTVGAALEAYIHGIPAMAISVSSKASISMEKIAQIMAKKIDYFYNTNKLFMYNINFPNALKDEKAQFVFTKQGYRRYANEFDIVKLEDGSTAYCMKGRAQDIGNDDKTDIETVKKGFISVTPLCIERTDVTLLNQLR